MLYIFVQASMCQIIFNGSHGRSFVRSLPMGKRERERLSLSAFLGTEDMRDHIVHISLWEETVYKIYHCILSHWLRLCLPFNTLRQRQNSRHFRDDIFKCIFLFENVWIWIKISLKFVPKVRINNIQAFVQIMAWRRIGDKPLSEPMMVNLLTHICVTRPQWVKTSNISCTLVGNKIVDHSDVVGAAPTGATFSFSFFNYIFIIDLIPGFNGLDKDNCKMRQETCKVWDLVHIILEIWQ